MPNEEKFIVLIVVGYTNTFVCVKVEKHSGTNKKKKNRNKTTANVANIVTNSFIFLKYALQLASCSFIDPGGH